MKKRLISFLLALIMMCSLAPMAFAASSDALEAADALHELGLFNGAGTNADGTPNYDLDRVPTRHEAVTMLVRLLGKEAEAKNGTWNIPFTDVDDWAKPHVGYAYTNGLTDGTSATTFGGNDTVTASQYITFVLRALGYTSGTDFQWDKPWELSDQIGLTDGEYCNNSEFIREDVVLISISALICNSKDSDTPLFSAIQNNGGIADDVEFAAQRPLKFFYCDGHSNAVRYEDAYIQNATVAKIGQRYLFKIALLPDHFYCAYFFPAEYQSDDNRGEYSERISLTSTDDADTATFFITEEFIYKNPINRTSMILNLIPILTAFPDDFKFAEGCEDDDDCILARIEATDLPR